MKKNFFWEGGGGGRGMGELELMIFFTKNLTQKIFFQFFFFFFFFLEVGGGTRVRDFFPNNPNLIYFYYESTCKIEKDICF